MSLARHLAKVALETCCCMHVTEPNSLSIRSEDNNKDITLSNASAPSYILDIGQSYSSIANLTVRLPK